MATGEGSANFPEASRLSPRQYSLHDVMTRDPSELLEDPSRPSSSKPRASAFSTPQHSGRDQFRGISPSYSGRDQFPRSMSPPGLSPTSSVVRLRDLQHFDDPGTGVGFAPPPLKSLLSPEAPHSVLTRTPSDISVANSETSPPGSVSHSRSKMAITSGSAHTAIVKSSRITHIPNPLELKANFNRPSSHTRHTPPSSSLQDLPLSTSAQILADSMPSTPHTVPTIDISEYGLPTALQPLPPPATIASPLPSSPRSVRSESSDHGLSSRGGWQSHFDPKTVGLIEEASGDVVVATTAPDVICEETEEPQVQAVANFERKEEEKMALMVGHKQNRASLAPPSPVMPSQPKTFDKSVLDKFRFSLSTIKSSLQSKRLPLGKPPRKMLETLPEGEAGLQAITSSANVVPNPAPFTAPPPALRNLPGAQIGSSSSLFAFKPVTEEPEEAGSGYRRQTSQPNLLEELRNRGKSAPLGKFQRAPTLKTEKKHKHMLERFNQRVLTELPLDLDREIVSTAYETLLKCAVSYESQLGLDHELTKSCISKVKLLADQLNKVCPY
eukprot:gnl/Hemi2/8317_TR2869_c0_g1_i1.p1 gnl/Hemi2/8317_TR2869_c0_g1~~gnl/Hemi2/8317_TR2869_c0_g1_i1.p1  ORF type:complete len:555 (+),score=81.27 gnl/Hemi2/8317_TR2869_c0_g1_i1:189-1853(+)